MTTHRRETLAEKQAHARWAARRRRLQAYGQWQPFVEAGPVREHVYALQQAGMPEGSIVRVLGMPRGALQSVMRGGGCYGPAAKVRRETAEAVLAFWPRLEDFPDMASISSVGTRRRVQALGVLGWTQAALADRVGRAEASFKNSVRADRVSARTARLVAAVYDELWTEDPEAHGVKAWVAERCRNKARMDGWHGPLAWDDDTIDDPSAAPQIDSPAPGYTEGDDVAARWLLGESVVLGPDDRKEVVRHLFEWTNDTTAEIADRLEITPDAAEQMWNRIKRSARLEGRRVWRRVYVPRERTMTQDQMEEAA